MILELNRLRYNFTVFKSVDLMEIAVGGARYCVNSEREQSSIPPGHAPCSVNLFAFNSQSFDDLLDAYFITKCDDLIRLCNEEKERWDFTSCDPINSFE